MLTALILLTAAADALPMGSSTRFKAAMEKWDHCLEERLQDAAELTNDPSNIVAEVTITACSSEQAAATFEYRRMLVAESLQHPSDERAELMASNTIAKITSTKRNTLQMRASFIRQQQTLARQTR